MREFFLRLLEPGEEPTVLAASIQNRSGRAIAVMRLVLALIFLGALWLDPAQPVRLPETAYLLLFAYTIVSAGLVAIAWSSWWYEFHLSSPAFLVDVIVFALAVFFTEGNGSDFNSPFLAFFVFLMASSTLRWHWQVTAMAAILILTSYLAAGGAMNFLGISFQEQVFLRRTSYMVVVAVAFVFFGMQRLGPRADTTLPEASEGDILEVALRYATQQFAAAGAAIRWDDRDEPTTTARLMDGSFVLLQAPQPPQRVSESTRLFDVRRKRELVQRRGRRRVFARRRMPDVPLATLAAFDEGLATPLLSSQGLRGQLIISAPDGASVDAIDRVKAIALAVVEMIEGRRLAEFERRRAVTQTREALARDLHDSVAQSLAGASFGLEALRRSLPEDSEKALSLLADLKQSLRNEQANVRDLIERLRFEADADAHVDLAAELDRVIVESRRRWGIEIVRTANEELHTAAPLAFECKQLVREAISNAVRHGGAQRVDIGARAVGDRLAIEIGNDGAPFATGAAAQPRTIRERVERLSGSFRLQSGRPPRLFIELPMGRGR